MKGLVLFLGMFFTVSANSMSLATDRKNKEFGGPTKVEAVVVGHSKEVKLLVCKKKGTTLLKVKGREDIVLLCGTYIPIGTVVEISDPHSGVGI